MLTVYYSPRDFTPSLTLGRCRLPCGTFLPSEPSHRPVTGSQMQHVSLAHHALPACCMFWLQGHPFVINLTYLCFSAVRPSPDSRNSQRLFSTQTVYCCGPAACCRLPCGTARAFHADAQHFHRQGSSMQADHKEKQVTSFVGQSSAGHG
jgi:hypothetical protein